MLKKTVLIVPTIRENSFNQFLARWHAIGLFNHVDLIVMEDNPKASFHVNEEIASGTPVFHYSWEDIEKELGVNSWIIPRRSDTVRSFAYYMAWKLGYERILTLDDDCYPPGKEDGLMYADGESFLNKHHEALSGDSRWFNTLNCVKPRGIPFYNVGKDNKTIVNHGLWTNVLDYDAPFQLANPIPEKFSFDSRIVPAGSYFPMCGMNVMWTRDATVLMYHLLMGQRICAQTDAYTIKDGVKQPILEKLPFDRFGDIWCGIFMKKIADHVGCRVRTGMPYIRHERASNPFTNLKKEANGIEVNEKLWEYVDKLEFDSDFTLAPFMFPIFYGRLGMHISLYDEYPEHIEYFKKLGEAMVVWANLFR